MASPKRSANRLKFSREPLDIDDLTSASSFSGIRDVIESHFGRPDASGNPPVFETDPTRMQYVWKPEQATVSVRLCADLIERLERESIQMFRAITNRGSEIGGILLGYVMSRNPLCVIVEDYEPVPCAFTLGSSFVLSGDELAVLREMVARRKEEEDGLTVVGFFRSNVRPTCALREEDLSMFDSLFPEEHNVFVVAKPFTRKPCQGAIFVREQGRIRSEASYLEFPFSKAELEKTEALQPAIRLIRDAEMPASEDDSVSTEVPEAPPAPVIAFTTPAPPAPKAPAPPAPPAAKPPEPAAVETRAVPRATTPAPPAPPAAKPPAPAAVETRFTPRAATPAPPAAETRTAPAATTSAPPAPPVSRPPAPAAETRIAPRAATPAPPAPPVSKPAEPAAEARVKPRATAPAPPVAEPKPRIDPPKPPAAAETRAAPPPAPALRVPSEPAPATGREFEGFAFAKAPEPSGSGRWMIMVLVLVLLGGAGFLWVSSSRREAAKPAAVQPVATAPAPTAPEPASAAPVEQPLIELRVEGAEGGVTVRWDATQPEVSSATKGRIAFQDGGVSSSFDLSSAELKKGAYTYKPKANDLTIRLETGPGTYGSIRVLGATRLKKPAAVPKTPGKRP